MKIDEFLRVHDLPTFRGQLPEWVNRDVRSLTDPMTEFYASNDLTLFVIIVRTKGRYWIGRYDPELERLQQHPHSRIWFGFIDEPSDQLDEGFLLPTPQNVPDVFRHFDLPTP
jgi:hypothetical protein